MRPAAQPDQGRRCQSAAAQGAAEADVSQHPRAGADAASASGLRGLVPHHLQRGRQPHQQDGAARPAQGQRLPGPHGQECGAAPSSHGQARRIQWPPLQLWHQRGAELAHHHRPEQRASCSTWRAGSGLRSNTRWRWWWLMWASIRWKTSGVRVHPQVTIAYDTGYQDLQKQHASCLKPVKATKKRPLTQEQNEASRARRQSGPPPCGVLPLEMPAAAGYNLSSAKSSWLRAFNIHNLPLIGAALLIFFSPCLMQYGLELTRLLKRQHGTCHRCQSVLPRKRWQNCLGLRAYSKRSDAAGRDWTCPQLTPRHTHHVDFQRGGRGEI